MYAATLLLCFCMTVAALPGKPMYYTIENEATDDMWEFRHTVQLKLPKEVSFFDIMKMAEEVSNPFEFDYETEADGDVVITLINNLDLARYTGYSWFLLIRDANGNAPDCVVPFAVNKYVAKHWGHMVMSYLEDDDVEQMTECTIKQLG